MSHRADEITSANREHSLGIHPLAMGDRDLLRDRVHGRYGVITGSMWEGLSAYASVHHPDGWQWISRFVGSRRCILFFDVGEEVGMFAIPSGEALHTLLAETTGFEFYLTDAHADYLICFNHHDVLLCCGSAREWLETLEVD